MSLVTIKDAFFSASLFEQELDRFSPWTNVNDESQPQKGSLFSACSIFHHRRSGLSFDVEYHINRIIIASHQYFSNPSNDQLPVVFNPKCLSGHVV